MINFFKRNFIKNLIQLLLSTLLLFAFFEGVFRLFGASGGGRFIERIVIHEHLSLRKPKDEFRIFTYGESTMRGAHYSPVSSPARWLQVYLKDFLPDRKIRVVDFSRLGAGSDFVHRAFRDTIPYQPDLALFYVGHNAFLPGNRKDQILTKRMKSRSRFNRWTRRSYFISGVYRWMIAWRSKFGPAVPEDKFEFSVIETPLPGVKLEDLIPRNNPSYLENIDFFRENILQILTLGEKHKIPILFFKPVCNLKDFAPTYSVHMKKLSAEELSQWEDLYEAGKRNQTQANWNEAVELYTQAYTIDSTYADLSFRLGQAYFIKGSLAEARRLFEEARDNDALPVRTTKEILGGLEEFARAGKLTLIDTEKVLVSEAPGGILGEPIIADNVHLSIKGHSLLGRLMAEKIAKRDWIAPKSNWRFDQARPYDEIAKELGVSQHLQVSADLRMVSYFGTRFENKIRFAKHALEIESHKPRALRYLAWTYWMMGEKKKALEVYRRLEQLDPSSLEEIFKAQPDIATAFKNISHRKLIHSPSFIVSEMQSAFLIFVAVRSIS